MSQNKLSDPFFFELYKRSARMSDKSSIEEVWVKVDISKASSEFVKKLDEYLEKNPDVFKLHLITGKDYFVEIFDCDSLLEAFMKAKL